MERNRRLWGFMITVFFLVLTQHVTGQLNNLYTCWGGCYNKCFLLGGKGPGDQYPCYFRCLSGCTFTQSDGNYQYYCQVGCSATRCIPLGSDQTRARTHEKSTSLEDKNSAKLEECLGGCTNICRA